jgi:hypothetical protein
VGRSRIVTVIDTIQIIEVTDEDLDGFAAGSCYYVQGEKYETLREAREAARKIAEQQGTDS